MSQGVYDNCGLHQQINEEVYREISGFGYLPKGLSARDRNFEGKWDEAWKDAFSKVDWLQFFSEVPMIPLSPEIKENIISKMDRMDSYKLGSEWQKQFIQSWLIYCFFIENDDDLDHLNVRIAEDYYNFMKEETNKRKIVIPSYFLISPDEKIEENQERFQLIQNQQQEKEEELQARLCPFCGSSGTDIVSSATNRYLCKICNRTFKRS
jgi:hypothetical protein